MVDKVLGIQQGEAHHQTEHFQLLAEEALSVCLRKASKVGEMNGNRLNKGQEEKGSPCNVSSPFDSVPSGFCVWDMDHRVKAKTSAQFQQLLCTF